MHTHIILHLCTQSHTDNREIPLWWLDKVTLYSFSMMISWVLASGDIFLNKIIRAQLWIRHLNFSCYSFRRQKNWAKLNVPVHLPRSPEHEWDSWRDSCKTTKISSSHDSPFFPSLYSSLLFSVSISLSVVLPVWHSGAEDGECQREQSVLIKDMPDPHTQEIHPEGDTEIS